MEGKIKDSQISLGTGLQYLSAAKSNGMAKYPNQGIWNDCLGKWMTSIRHDLSRKITAFNIERGVANSFKAPPIGRVVLGKIAEHLIKANNAESIHRRLHIVHFVNVFIFVIML